MSYPRLITLAAVSALFAAFIVSRPGSARSVSSVAQESHARLPLAFEPNRGQAAADVEFIARASGYTLELSRATARMVLEHRITCLSLVGARPSAAEGAERRAGTVNYFIGNDPSRWLTGIATYAQVRYRDVYPGVDLLFDTADQAIEYDFLVHPGGDPRQIALTFAG